MTLKPVPFQLVDDIADMAADDGGKALRRSVWLHALEAAVGTIPLGLVYLLLLVLEGHDPEAQHLLWLLVAAIASLVVQFFCARAADREASLSGYAALCNLRLRLAEHLRSLPLGFFGRRKSGDLATVIAENVQMAEELLTHLIPTLLGQFLSALFVALLLLAIDWRLGLAALVTVPLGGLVMRALRGRFAALHRARVEQLGELGTRLLEFVQGIRVIRAFALTAERFAKLDRSLRQLRDTSIRLEIFGGLAFYSFATVLELGFLLVVFLGARYIASGAIAVPAFLMAMFLSQRLCVGLAEATSSFAMVSYMGQGVARIRDLMSESPLPLPQESCTPSSYDISLDDVVFHYGSDAEDGAKPVAPEPVLEHVSARIPANAMTALVGSSGSGKSTFLSLIARFHDVQSGSVRIGGSDVREIAPGDLFGMISMVFQNVYLFSGTILDNIRLGRPEASDDEVIATARAAGCDSFISAFPERYETWVGEGGMSLSGGERQRISIARAILKDAPIVLLDEATASVDAMNEAHIRASIKTLTASKTVVTIAHRLETILEADQILVIEKGRIVERGTHAELQAAGRHYAALLANMIEPMDASGKGDSL